MADTKPAISYGAAIDPDVLKNDFAMMKVPADQGRLLRFRLALPRDWRELPDRMTDPDDQLSIAASFAASNDVSITLLQAVVPFEINLRDWLEYQCHLRGFRIEALETQHARNGTEVHAVGQTGAGDHLRMVVVGDGDKLLWFVGRSAARIAVEYEDSLGLSAASIRIKPYSGVDTREPLKTYRDAEGLYLLYPASWNAERLSRYLPSRAAADFRIVQKDDAIAYLRVESDRSPAAGKPGSDFVFRRLIADIEGVGIEVPPLSQIPAPVQGGTGPAEDDHEWVGDCKLPTGSGHIAVLIRRDGDRWLLGVLICPEKTLNPMAWMRGKRFFEIVVASLRSSPARSNEKGSK